MFDTHALCMGFDRLLVFALRLLNFLGSTTSKTSRQTPSLNMYLLPYQKMDIQQDKAKILKQFQFSKIFFNQNSYLK